ncbi:interleukin-7 isoform X2 [Lutra lutra]|uniref:interleukin-7 isoform X2 n=1 Tax=Lutra lutra TaxID=9657 RepID=UPI001FD0CAEB|nr:interleukin-7 isoform X2 [Lutra lutra]
MFHVSFRYIFGIPPLILVLLPVASSDCDIEGKEGREYQHVLMISINDLVLAKYTFTIYLEKRYFYYFNFTEEEAESCGQPFCRGRTWIRAFAVKQRALLPLDNNIGVSVCMGQTSIWNLLLWKTFSCGEVVGASV